MALGKAFGVGINSDGNILITDVLNHVAVEFKPQKSQRGVALEELRTWGRPGTAGNNDGAIRHATLDEPMGVASDGETWFVAGFGGETHGSVSYFTATDYAVEYCKAVDDLYLGIGYQPRNQTDVERLARQLPYHAGKEKMRSSCEWFEEIDQKRRAYFDYDAVAGPESSLCSRTIGGLRVTLDALDRVEAQCETFPELKAALKKSKFRPWGNEHGVEHNFGFLVDRKLKKQQSDLPTMKQ